MKHTSRFMGQRLLKRYDNHNRYDSWEQDYEPKVYEYHIRTKFEVWEDDNLFYTHELDDPPLKPGDYIYLHELKANVKVEAVYRSTDGTYTYSTDYAIEILEDEHTFQTKEKAEKEYAEYKEKKARQAEIKKRPWWKIF